MIGDSEKKWVYFSDMLPEVAPKTYAGLVEVLDKYGVRHSLLKGTKSIWCRDYMPVQTEWDTPEGGVFKAFRYEPDYLMEFKKHQKTMTDGHLAYRENISGGVLDDFRDMVKIDGGNIIGRKGHCIMTMKVFEENPQYSVAELSVLLEKTLKARITFLPWDRHEIYGHADGIARFAGDGSVIMTNYSQFAPKMAKAYRKMLEAAFGDVHELRYDTEKPGKYSWAYINWLQTDKVLVLPKFNTPEDKQALRQISELMPEYKGRIEMVDATDLIIHGGCLNCASWTVGPIKPHCLPVDIGVQKLEEAIFPCYGVKVYYSDGRIEEREYPNGMEDPFPEIG